MADLFQDYNRLQDALGRYKRGEITAEEYNSAVERIKNADYGFSLGDPQHLFTGNTDAQGAAVEDVFDPGKDERKDARQATEGALEDWEDFRREYDDRDLTMEWGTDIKPYDVGDPLKAEKQLYFDPGDSEFANIGSEYEGLESSYSGLPGSAYSDLKFSDEALAGMGGSEDYFADLMTDGRDAIADADYARRQAQAEQARRSHTDAALRDAEMRGQGGASDRLLAELSGTQAMAGDLYQAGMDANALSQARRDSAAGTRADIAERMGARSFDADATRAAGMDAYGFNQAAGQDAFALNRAGGQDAFNTNRAGAMDDWTTEKWDDFYDLQDWNTNELSGVNRANWDRTNSISDADVDKQNELTQWNTVGAPNQAYNWEQGALSGRTNAAGGFANTSLQAGSQAPNWGTKIIDVASNLPKAVASDDDEDD